MDIVLPGDETKGAELLLKTRVAKTKKAKLERGSKPFAFRRCGERANRSMHLFLTGT